MIGPRRLAVLAFLGPLLAGAPAAAQIPGLSPTPTAAAEAPGDPYRRETPYGSFFGYMHAAARGNWTQAAEYLQWPKSARTPPEEVAKQLKAVLDERFSGDLEKLSRSALGNVNDGLSPDLERAGTVVHGDESFDILLVRTQPPEGPALWLVASQTLREVPAAFRSLRAPQLDSLMPAPLRRSVGGSLRLWQVLAFFGLLFVAWLLARLLSFGLLRLIRAVARRRPSAVESPGLLDPFRPPFALLAGVLLHAFCVSQLGLPLLGRYSYGRAARVVAVAAIGWFFVRLVAFLTSRATLRLLASGQTAASSLTIGRKVLQGLVITGTVLVILGIFGVNLTATLAGVGIGGIAIAFAAQKSLENLFGGFVVLSDKVVRVGDFVRVGEVLGGIEDVTLYATRIRTLERVVVSIPNGILMTSRIENLSRRDKFLFRHTLGLATRRRPRRCRPSSTDVGRRLAADARVETRNALRAFVRLSAYSLDVEVFAYVLVPDWAAFLAAQEELLLALMEVVEEAGKRRSRSRPRRRTSRPRRRSSSPAGRRTDRGPRDEPHADVQGQRPPDGRRRSSSRAPPRTTAAGRRSGSSSSSSRVRSSS